MNNASRNFEITMGEFAKELAASVIEAADLRAFYYASNASALVDALSQNTTPATVSTGLTKIGTTNFVGVITELGKFMNNQSANQIAALTLSEVVLEKTTVAPAILSHAVEAVGERMKALARKLCDLYGGAVELSSIYDAQEIGAVASALDEGSIVFGSDTTAGTFIAGATLLVQFRKLMNNETTSQGDYLNTVSKWS